MTRKNPKSGIALFMVLVALALLSVLAVEIRYSSGVDSRISRNLKERLQAHYLAMSAARLSILRLHLYKEVKNLKSGSGSAVSEMISDSMLNQIWSSPTPPMPFTSMKEVIWPGVISSTIESEGSKIPINYLDGNKNRESSEELQNSVKEQIRTLISGKLEDETFGDKYRDLNIDELISNLKDWIDIDTTKETGGFEADDYERLDYKPRDGRIPVLSEIHMIKGWNEELYEIIAKPHFSVLNSSTTIDPNFISLDRLKSIHPPLTQEDLAAIEKRRFEQPFTSIDDLANFITSSGEVSNGRGFSFGNSPVESKKVEDVFYIKASGKVAETQRSYKIGVRFTYVKSKPQSGAPPKTTNVLTEDEKSKAKFDKLYIVSIEELI